MQRWEEAFPERYRFFFLLPSLSGSALFVSLTFFRFVIGRELCVLRNETVGKEFRCARDLQVRYALHFVILSRAWFFGFERMDEQLGVIRAHRDLCVFT